MSIRRYLATFYRGRWLYLPVLAIMLASTLAGTYYLARNQYEATARIWVERPILDNVLAPTAQTGFAAPPAQQQADKLYQLLQTDAFVVGIVKRTGWAGQLTGLPDTDARLIRQVRGKLGVTALGSNTVKISFAGSDPALCQQMVQGTIDQFRTWDLTARVEQNTIERQFFEKQLQIYQNQLDDAAKRVGDFQRDNPYPDPASPQYLELQRLQRELESARGLYTTTKTKIEQASAAESLGDNSRKSEFQVLDAPTVPTRPSATLTRLAKYLGLGLAASFGLIVAAVVFATWQDTSVRSPDDLQQLTGLPLLEVIPHLPPLTDEDRARQQPGYQAARQPRQQPADEQAAT